MTRHVVLVTYGEPTTASFSEQLVYSWRILVGLTRTVAPIPRPLLPVIALSRARSRNRMWTAANYTSPLEPITAGQARQLEGRLNTATGAAWKVHAAYEFRQPLLSETLVSLPSDEPVWVVPMYAADSAFTHALSRATAEAHAASGSRRDEVRVLGPLDGGGLAEISAAHVLEHAAEDAGWRGQDVALVLAAHGTVLKPPRPIDTGLAATEALCQGITWRLASHFGMVVNGWLNHSRGGPWTDPPIEAALQQVADAGYKRVVYYPYGFLADNAESELEGRMALAHTSFESRHLPCLNESARLMDALARQVSDAAGIAPREADGGRARIA
jgi:protoheme ferro-lyase